MRICIIGKYPPIQGGVSMRNYWTARRLAERGHDVHVVTNAREVAPPFRMHMCDEDWARCEADFDNGGSVRVHWTDPVDRSQSYIPMASPFVTKLAGIAGRLHAERPFDVIFSHYMEPYGIAGHLVAGMTGAPHVVRMAGSDAGRLWHHPQFEPLYDHVLKSAEFVVLTGPVAERAAARGIDPARIVPGGSYVIPEDIFSPAGPLLDLAALADEAAQDDKLRDLTWGGFAGERPYFGIYGKLGDNKGSFALLDALHRLRGRGLDVGLVAMAHGRAPVERRFRERAQELGLYGDTLQIPFLPHWRVPEFLRGCLAVCCLEQDFPIGFHSPIIPIEVMLAGSCLVASTELIRKLPDWEQLPHRYGCVAVNNVNDIDELSGKLGAILERPELTAVVGARGWVFAHERQQGLDFPAKLEGILQAAAERRELTAPEPVTDGGNAPTVEAAARDCDPSADVADPLFRIDIEPWALAEDALGRLLPVRSGATSHEPLLTDPLTARILELSDGAQTADDILRRLDAEFGPGDPDERMAWLEHLLVIGLLGLQDPRRRE